ncbi:tRNA(adenine(34)) deaminase, chloroplastic [Linum perenne]
MHNVYMSSTLLSIGTHHGSISISSNDFPNSYCRRFEKSPQSQCCACCCCCCTSSSLSSSFAIQPSLLLYGLRQSSLIQWTPSRRVNLGTMSRSYRRVPGCGLDLGGYEVSCGFEETSGRRKEKSSRRLNLRPSRCLDSANDAECVLDLLSEEVSDEYLEHRRRIGEFAERLQKVRKKGGYAGECESERRKNLRLRLLASKSKRELQIKEEGSRMKEERNEKEDVKAVYEGEPRRVRTMDSVSLSSYYSLSSEGELESDKEEAREEEGPSDGYMKELGESSSEAQVVGDGSEKQMEVLERRRTSSIGWDLRNKSEKKLSDVEETEYSMQSRLASSNEDHHKESMKSRVKIDDVSHEYKVFDGKEESSVAASLEKGATSRYDQRAKQAMKQSEFGRNNQKPTDRQEIFGTSGEEASQYHRLLPGGEGIAGRSGKDRRSSSQELTKITEMGKVGVERIPSYQRQTESRTKIQEESMSSRLQNSGKHDQMGTRKMTRQTESRVSSEETSEGHHKYIGSTFSTSNTRMKNQRESTSSFSASESGAEGQKFRPDKKAVERVQSRKEPKNVTNLTVNVTNASLVNTTNTETVVNSQRLSEQIIVDQGRNMAVTEPIQKPGGLHAPADANNSQLKLVQEAQRVSKASSLRRKSSGGASSSEVTMQQVERRPEAVMVPPSRQLVGRSSFHVDSTDGVKVQDVSEGTSLSFSGGSYTNSGENVPEIHQESEYKDLEGELYDDSLHLPTPEDALGSARRIEASSMQYVGEFVERARLEMSSETDQNQPTSSGQHGPEDSKGNNSRHSSKDSGEKGPSAEMWDVADPSILENPKADAPEEREGTTNQAGATVTEGSAIRKTGRSMWGIIGDIVRLRWGPRTETSKPGTNSGGKSSSNDSAGSEAWFSGHDPDENSERRTKQETSLPKGYSSEGGEASGTGESKPVTGRDDVATVSPTIILSGSTSRAFASPEKDLDWSPDEKRSEVTSGVGGETSTISLPVSTRSSPIIKQSSGNRSRSDTSRTSLTEQPLGSKVEESSSVEKEGELKRRKLQRNKQVIRDRFDDWEEAYILESEQRKMDEMFMREALVEAKKAADTWEVPVGAVLVQHGNIIARGYNLVEELRDSTAHAEMICIREASNQLRSWRLADATLYVTLEPCPMCAGAILQARIDTVVWGAPNKLLGADGSWIRLFPNGEGGSGLETDKPAPPVHPFHPKMTIRRGVLATECADVMKQFFQLRRTKKTKEDQQQQQPPQNSLVRVANHPSKILKKMHDIFHVMFCL